MEREGGECAARRSSVWGSERRSFTVDSIEACKHQSADGAHVKVAV